MSTFVRKTLRAYGAVLKRRSKHDIYELPNGRIVAVSKSPSDWRWERNFVREIAERVRL